MLPDGKETKVIIRHTANEATAITQLMANDVSGIKSAWPRSHCGTHRYLNIPTVNQWRHDLRSWLSSPDPSTNHIILCGAQHQGTSQWFFRGNLFEVWKTTGSLLWIHGKRTSPNPRPSLFYSLMTCLYSGFWKECPLVRCF